MWLLDFSKYPEICQSTQMKLLVQNLKTVVKTSTWIRRSIIPNWHAWVAKNEDFHDCYQIVLIILLFVIWKTQTAQLFKSLAFVLWAIMRSSDEICLSAACLLVFLSYHALSSWWPCLHVEITKTKNFLAFKLSDAVFIMPINVKMQTFFGILTLMSMKHALLSWAVESGKSFITFRTGLKVINFFHAQLS